MHNTKHSYVSTSAECKYDKRKKRDIDRELHITSRVIQKEPEDNMDNAAWLRDRYECPSSSLANWILIKEERENHLCYNNSYNSAFVRSDRYNRSSYVVSRCASSIGITQLRYSIVYNASRAERREMQVLRDETIFLHIILSVNNMICFIHENFIFSLLKREIVAERTMMIDSRWWWYRYCTRERYSHLFSRMSMNFNPPLPQVQSSRRCNERGMMQKEREREPPPPLHTLHQ